MLSEIKCDRPVHCKGLCHVHYHQQLAGRPFAHPKRMRQKDAVLERDKEGRKKCTWCDRWQPEENFASNARISDGLHSHCQTCARARRRANTQQDKEYRRRVRLARYGMTPESFDRLFDSQGNVCAICGTDTPVGRGWNVDHDHACCPGKSTCGKCIRGILCFNCNTGIGKFGDSTESLLAAVAYIKKGTVELE